MTDQVKVLSDDALREIEARRAAVKSKWTAAQTPNDGRWAILGPRFESPFMTGVPVTTKEVAEFISKAPDDIDALCATVRALRFRLAQAEQAFELESAVRLPEVGNLNVLQIVRKMAELHESHTALREQLAQRDFRIKTLKQDLEQVQKNNARFQSELAQAEAARDQLSAALSVRDAQLKEMKDRLAQVTQDRDSWKRTAEAWHEQLEKAQ